MTLKNSKVHTLRDFLFASHEFLKTRENASWNALAQTLQVATRTSIKKIFSGEKPIAKKSLRLLCDNLELSDLEIDYVESLRRIECVSDADELTSLHRRVLDLKKKLQIQSDFAPITTQQMKLMSRWYHLHVLYAIDIHQGTADRSKLLKSLHGQLNSDQLEESIQLLLSLKLISESIDGCLQKLDGDFAMVEPLPNTVLREFHKQMIERALSALTHSPHDTRHSASTTFTIEQSDFPEIQKQIVDFCQHLVKVYSKPHANTVIQLNTQLFQSAHRKVLK